MMRIGKKITALAVSAAVLLSVFAACLQVFAQSSAETLRFGADGSFTILQFTDTQDTQNPSPNLVNFIRKALDEAKPDLVVFTGDQLKNYDSDFEGPGVQWKVKKALDAIIAPVVKRRIPFAVAFGNHDSCLDVTLEQQVAMMRQYKGCLVVDEGPSVSGCGNYNVPILSSDGTRTAFNLYFLDSGQSAVLPDQIAWYVSKSNELKESNAGVPVPSIEFQHIVPFNYDLVSAFAAQGDVIASFCGHNHYRSDNDPWLGIDRVYTPTSGFNAFGPGKESAARVIELNESDTTGYSTRLLTFIGLFGDNPLTDLRYMCFTLWSMESDNALTKTMKIMAGIMPAMLYGVELAGGNPARFLYILMEFFGADITVNGL